MRPTSSIAPLLVAAALLGIPTDVSSGGRDVHLEAPEGWHFALPPVADALGDEHVVRITRDDDSADALLYRKGSRSEILDVPHRVADVRFSSDGGVLLVRRPAPDDACDGGGSLVTTDGSVLWRRTEPTRLEFAADGLALLAWSPPGRCGPGTSVEILGLDGRVRRSHDAGRPLFGATSFAAGNRLVVAHADALVALDLPETAGAPPVEVWRIPHGFPVEGVRAVGFDRAVAEGPFGRFLLFDADGRALYRYDPVEIAGGDADNPWARRRPYESGAGGAPLLFDGATAPFRVRTDGERPRRIDADLTPPRGLVLDPRVRRGQALFHSRGTVVFRRLPSP